MRCGAHSKALEGRQTREAVQWAAGLWAWGAASIGTCWSGRACLLSAHTLVLEGLTESNLGPHSKKGVLWKAGPEVSLINSDKGTF